MAIDLEEPEFEPVPFPPLRGPGSGKDAWREFAWKAAAVNSDLRALIERQQQTIRELRADNDLLRQQIAKRRPPGGREPTPIETVSRIERAIAAGGTTRHIARQFGVSAMTVSRIAARMRARQTA